MRDYFATAIYNGTSMNSGMARHFHISADSLLEALAIALRLCEENYGMDARIADISEEG